MEGISELPSQEEYHSLISKVYELAQKTEEDVIAQVLKELLKRDPTIEDYKKCTLKFREQISDRYILAYEDTDLGEVVRNYLTPPKNCFDLNEKPDYSVTFTPNKTFS